MKGGEYEKIVLQLKDSTAYLAIRHQCDSLSAVMDSIRLKQKKSEWSYYREQPIKYIGDKGTDTDDCIYLYIKTDKSLISGFYIYKNDKSKNKQYRYHVFKGTIGKTELNPKDSLNYRAFELTSHDIANNEETIKGKLCTSNKDCDFKIFMHSRQIAESIKK